MIKGIIIAVVIAILITAWYFLIYKPGQTLSMEGTPCRGGAANLPGAIVNGQCVIGLTPGGGLEGGTDTGRMASTNLSLSAIPSSQLSTMSISERRIVDNLFNLTNQYGFSQAALDNANLSLSRMGSRINFVRNPIGKDNVPLRAKCIEGYDCWSINLIVFTMCRCRSYNIAG